MNVALLRVGIDSGCGGIAGPLFSDGTFEFVPIDSDRHRGGHMYGNLIGRYRRRLIEYFPDRLRQKMRNCFVHDDPEFKSYTYGDPTRPKQRLKTLEKGDLLVFYAGLCGWGRCNEPTGLYIIGYFEVETAGLYPDLVTQYSKRKVCAKFANNWHIVNRDTRGRRYKQGRKSELVLVRGGAGSKLLKKAVRLSAPKKKLDRGGHRVFILDPALEKYFGKFTRLNAIQRSIPRFVEPQFVDRAAKFVRSLK